MPNKTVETTNMTFQVQPNGNVHIRRRLLRSFVGVVLGLLFIAIGIVLFMSLLSGKASPIYVPCGLFVFGVVLLIYSGKELGAPDILIEKSLRRVTQQSRWPFRSTVQIWPLDAFVSVAYHVIGYITTRRSKTSVYGVSLVFPDGKTLPLAEITPKQREQVMEILKTATGLPEYQSPGK